MAQQEFGPGSKEDEEKKKTYSYYDIQKEADENETGSILDWSIESSNENDSWFDSIIESFKKEEEPSVEDAVETSIIDIPLPEIVEPVVEMSSEPKIESEPEELQEIDLNELKDIKDAEDETEPLSPEIPDEVVSVEQDDVDIAEVAEVLTDEIEEEAEPDEPVQKPIPPSRDDQDETINLADAIEEEPDSKEVEESQPTIDDKEQPQEAPQVIEKETQPQEVELVALEITKLKELMAETFAVKSKQEAEVEPLTQEITEAEPEDEKDSEELLDEFAIDKIASKIDRQVKRLDTLSRRTEKIEAADIQKSVIAVSEKLAAMPNKLQQQKVQYLRSLMEVIGFENVDQSIELMIKQYGEQFIDQLVSQMLQLLREERIEMRGTTTQAQQKLLRNLRSKAIGRFVLLINRR